ncbi:hypothetical protein Taro_028481 [Colocasia esculenta]|uniref:Uncharacterized protein n=1 Tax=Colocasia esculenta TaxID=4460 RepID=A0A843VXD0_COLES|nr:hypothetical protein [Colocasia esculenta]
MRRTPVRVASGSGTGAEIATGTCKGRDGFVRSGPAIATALPVVFGTRRVGYRNPTTECGLSSRHVLVVCA